MKVKIGQDNSYDYFLTSARDTATFGTVVEVTEEEYGKFIKAEAAWQEAQEMVARWDKRREELKK